MVLNDRVNVAHLCPYISWPISIPTSTTFTTFPPYSPSRPFPVSLPPHFSLSSSSIPTSSIPPLSPPSPFPPSPFLSSSIPFLLISPFQPLPSPLPPPSAPPFPFPASSSSPSIPFPFIPPPPPFICDVTNVYQVIEACVKLKEHKREACVQMLFFFQIPKYLYNSIEYSFVNFSSHNHKVQIQTGKFEWTLWIKFT